MVVRWKDRDGTNQYSGLNAAHQFLRLPRPYPHAYVVAFKYVGCRAKNSVPGEEFWPSAVLVNADDETAAVRGVAEDLAERGYRMKVLGVVHADVLRAMMRVTGRDFTEEELVEIVSGRSEKVDACRG